LQASHGRMSGRSPRQQWRRLSVIELVTMNKTTQPTGETEASAQDLSDEDSRPVLEGDVGTDDGISSRTALRFNGKHRRVASHRKKYWRRLLKRARLPAARRSAPHRAKGASTVENGPPIMKRWNRLEALEDLGSLLSPTEALAACPLCHSREIWVEKHPNSARSLSIMCRQCRFQVSLLPRAQAIAAWNGMGTAE
jgi:hypothetical protein